MEYARFTLGSFQCCSVLDATAVYAADQIFANAPRAELAPLLRPYSDDPDKVPGPYACLFIDTGRQRVLVDTGAGDLKPTSGRLRQNLRAAGVAPEDVDLVILTHGHPDHIAGNVAGDALAFPNARYVMGRDEWAFWTAEDALRTVPASWAAHARRHLPPIRDRVELIDREGEIVPGVGAVFAPGHTLGHLAVEVASGGDRLLYLSDTALHPVLLQRPDWHSVFDMDRQQADATLRRLADRAADERLLVHAFHFPFPCLGRIERCGNGWQWRPWAEAPAPTTADAAVTPPV